MKAKIGDKIAYIIAVVNEFAAKFSLNSQQAYRYLDRFKALNLWTNSIMWSILSRLRMSWRTWRCTVEKMEGDWHDIISRFKCRD